MDNFLSGLPPLKPKAVAVKPEGFQKTVDREVSAVRESFIKRAMKESARLASAIDTEYWFCVCFQNRMQKEAFLKAMDLTLYGDKYLDGARFADKLGVKLPPFMATSGLKRPADKKLEPLILDF